LDLQECVYWDAEDIYMEPGDNESTLYAQLDELTTMEDRVTRASLRYIINL
jgi:hypothetical protein